MFTDISPDRLVNTYRTFGHFGPTYQILNVISCLENDSLMKIRILESGEELEYEYSHILNDPIAEVS